MRKNLQEARKKAGLTQQAMAEKLDISLVYYQKIESGSRTGDYRIWDMLEEVTGIHQRALREIEETDPAQEADQLALPEYPRFSEAYPKTENAPPARTSDKH